MRLHSASGAWRFALVIFLTKDVDNKVDVVGIVGDGGSKPGVVSGNELRGSRNVPKKRKRKPTPS